MAHRIITASLAAILLFGSAQLSKADPERDQRFVQMGVGTITCAKYGQIYAISPDTEEDELITWVQGYLSAKNQASFNNNDGFFDLNNLPRDAQIFFLRAYCNSHPLAPVFDAAENLSNQFKWYKK